MGKELPATSEAELDVLKVLWACGPSTVREVGVALRAKKKRWAYTTTLTFLQRLKDKGYVVSNRAQAAHIFRAAVSQADVIHARLQKLASEVCDDSAEPVLRALQQTASFSHSELAALRKMLVGQTSKTAKSKRRKTG